MEFKFCMNNTVPIEPEGCYNGRSFKQSQSPRPIAVTAWSVRNNATRRYGCRSN